MAFTDVTPLMHQNSNARAPCCEGNRSEWLQDRIGVWVEPITSVFNKTPHTHTHTRTQTCCPNLSKNGDNSPREKKKKQKPSAVIYPIDEPAVQHLEEITCLKNSTDLGAEPAPCMAQAGPWEQRLTPKRGQFRETTLT